MLAYLILKESIKCFELVILLMSLSAVLTFSIAGDHNDQESGPGTSLPIWLIYGLLALSPLLSSGGIIAMRKMKKFHEAVVSWYLNWLLLLTSLTMIFVLKEGFQIFFNFDYISWLLMVGIGVLAVTSQTARFKALKRYKAAQLQLLNPVITLLQFGYDVSQGTNFNLIQYSAIGFLFLIYII